MSATKDLVARIREYEASSSVDRLTNEKALPVVQSILNDIDRFEFGAEDLDIRQSLLKCAEKAKTLKPDSITPEDLDELLQGVSSAQEEIIRRYSERMERYASRQSNL